MNAINLDRKEYTLRVRQSVPVGIGCVQLNAINLDRKEYALRVYQSVPVEIGCVQLNAINLDRKAPLHSFLPRKEERGQEKCTELFPV